MTFLPDFSVLLTYSLACFVLFVTPGPDMSLFLAKTVAGGRKAGMASMLGAMTGCCVHTLLAAFGLSALLAASATAFTVLKVVGALYLLWMAVDAVRHGSALNLKDDARSEVSFVRTFLLGVGIQRGIRSPTLSSRAFRTVGRTTAPCRCAPVARSTRSSTTCSRTRARCRAAAS